MTRALAKEFAPSVRVNCVMPGPFATDLMAGHSEDGLNALAASLPLGRIGDVQDMSGVVLWLASAASAYATGQVFAVDGGQSA
jgi:NAD(P)-dependent dehydrogenase (short-subunit alcohol dehydrogenase family)